MSKSDRDQRGRPHSNKTCPEARNGGCAYCKTGEYKRSTQRTARGQKRKQIKEQLA